MGGPEMKGYHQYYLDFLHKTSPPPIHLDNMSTECSTVEYDHSFALRHPKSSLYPTVKSFVSACRECGEDPGYTHDQDGFPGTMCRDDATGDITITRPAGTFTIKSSDISAGNDTSARIHYTKGGVPHLAEHVESTIKVLPESKRGVISAGRATIGTTMAHSTSQNWSMEVLGRTS